jgi:hypothetical protein
MSSDANKSILRGIVFFAVCPVLAILGGMLWSDFFVLDTPAHPAKWEYTAGPIMLFAGLAFSSALSSMETREQANDRSARNTNSL